MAWHGEFAFAPTALVFRGRSAENRLHAHAALQCVWGRAGIVLQDGQGGVFEGPGWLVRSGVAHRLLPAGRLVLLLLEPQSPLARALQVTTAAAPIAALPEAAAELLAGDGAIESLLPALQQRFVAARTDLDRRVLQALDAVDNADGVDSVAVAAAHAGLSPSRFRALCRQQFGVPFAKLLLWRKVRRACLAMAAGESLAQAAASAGFADQAHMTRTMSEVIGLTPGEAAQAAD